MHEPMGIDIEPFFSWILRSEKTNVMQTAYLLQVTDPAGCEAWNSGICHEDTNTFIPYAGTALESCTVYTVRLTVWDNQGEEAHAVTHFETAYMEKERWTASWVKSVFPVFDRSAHLGEQPQTVCFRKEFSLRDKPLRARAYCTSHGCYELYINGEKANASKLTPDFTTYRAYLSYQTYDIGHLLTAGKNVLGMMVGDGWYHGFMSKNPAEDYDPQYGVILQIEVEYPDGTAVRICSGEGVTVSLSPILCADLYAGERYDARLEQPEWSSAGFAEEPERWLAALPTDWNKDNLVAQFGEPVRVIKELPVKEVLHTPAGDTVLDFGQVIAGVVRMHVNEPAGRKITVCCTEGLDEVGNFFDNNPTADQRTEYISNGKEAVFEPHFAYQGFRYILVSGVSELREEDYTALVYSSPNESLRSFECSDPRLNRLYENTRWSQWANMISIPTDCPQREKAGWLGDIQVYTRTALLNEDVTAFLTRWLHQVRLEQRSNGALPIIAPIGGVFLNQYMGLAVQAGETEDVGAAGWADAVVMVPWYMYEITGNHLILRQQYKAMKAWCDYVIRKSKEKKPQDSTLPDEIEKYLWNTGYHYGEHLIPSFSKDGYSEGTFQAIYQSTKYVAPIYAYISISTFAKISELLLEQTSETDQADWKSELRQNAAFYGEQAQRIRGAIQKGVIGPHGEMPADLMGAYALPLYYGLVPEHLQQHFVEKLTEHIAKNGGCLDTGFLGTPVLLDTLCQIGRQDLAYDLLFQTKAPSWLYEVEHGATTIWESWFALDETGAPFVQVFNDMKFCMSLNHYAFGCVDDWIFRTVNGIQSIGAGFKKIRIAPIVDKRLSCAKRTYTSEQGNIVSEWSVDQNDVFSLYVEIPCNTTATVHLPDDTEHTVGSGRYHFTCNMQKAI